MPREPEQKPRTGASRAAGAGAAAGAAVGAAGAAAGAAPAAAGLAAIAVAGVLTAKAAKGIAQGLIDGLDAFGDVRFAESMTFLLTQLRARYPDKPPTEISKLLEREREFEVEFRRKMRDRLRRDFPKALAISEPAGRMAAVRKLLDREKRFTLMREDAMLNRAIAAVERDHLKELSPRGAYWRLSDYVVEHTLDCLVMGNKFWPWKVLDRIHPPMHAGCPCELWGLDEAIEAGFMLPDQVPDEKDAIRNANRLLKEVEELRDAIGVDEIEEAALELVGVPGELLEGTHSGAMVALYPDEKVAKALAQDGGEPWQDIHLTLAYLGKSDGLSDPAKVRKVVEGFAATVPALAGEVSGIGMFTAGPEPVLYASADVPGLGEFRAGLVKALKRAGLPVAEDHGFTPHLTLRYGEGDFPGVPNRKLRFRKVAVRLGDKKFEYDLAGELSEARGIAVAAAGLTALAADGGTNASTLRAVDPINRPGVRGKRHALRWGKGFEKGGEFRPVRGGERARVLARKLFPDGPPVSPAQARERGDSRWTWVRGQYLRVPHADGWRKTVGSVTYTSPPGSTNVYRNDRLISEPGGPSLPDERRPVPASPGVVTAPQAVSDRIVAKRAELRRQARARMADRKPARKGDGPAVLLSLPHEGFVLKRAVPAAGGSVLEFQKGDAELLVGWDGKQITEVDWRPTPLPQERRVAAVRAPRSFKEFKSDVLAWADEAGVRFESEVVLPTVRTERRLSDHAGTRLWDGEVLLGREVERDIDRAAASRAAGRLLSDDEKRGVYSAYWAAAHEAVGHSVNPISPFLYRGAHAHLEEALAEEISHLIAVERLTEQGQLDVVEWRRDNPQALAVQGNYHAFRHELAAILDEAGIDGEMGRREFLFDLKFRMEPAQRFDRLAEAVHAKRGGDMAEVRERVEERMVAPPSVLGYRTALNFTQSPGKEQVGVSYGRFADGVLSEDGRELRLPGGARRRVEKLPIIWPELAGMTDGSAVVHYPAEAEVAEGLAYADGSPKNYRFVDTEDRAKLILRAFAGQGSPGTAPDPAEVRRVAEELKSAKGLVWVEGVPVKRRFDGGYGIGWFDDGRNLSGVWGEENAARVALLRSTTDPPWGKPQPGVSIFPESPGTGDPRMEKLGWVGHDPPPPQRAALKRFLDANDQDGQSPYVHGVTPEGWIEVWGDGGTAYVTPDGRVEWRLPPSVRLASKLPDPPASPGTTGGLFDDFMGVPDPPMSPGAWLKKMDDLFGDPKKKPDSKPKKKPKPPKPEFIGGKKGEVPKGPIPAYDSVRLELGKSAGGSNGARWAFDKGGGRWLLKTYRGDQDRIATELLANRIYKAMGATVAEAGTIDVKGKPALTYKALDGKVKQYVFKNGKPSAKLGEHFMVDALLANWDYVGMTDDNVLWQEVEGEEDTPVRIDQGGTFEFRAQGQEKPFGPVPTEVWTMLRKGQAKRGAEVTEEGMRKQGLLVEEKLTGEVVDELVDAAPFEDNEMRERVRENLKARISWMGAFGRGEVDLPQPLEGDAARDELWQKEEGLNVYPEEEDALFAFSEGMSDEINSFLRSGKKRDEASKPVTRAVKALDGLLGAARATRDDIVAYTGFSVPVNEDTPADTGKEFEGRSFEDRGYLMATLDADEATQFSAVMRLVIPEGTKVLFPDGLGYEDLPEERRLIFPRGMKVRFGNRRIVDGKVWFDATVSAPAPKWSAPAAPKKKAQVFGEGDKVWHENSKRAGTVTKVHGDAYEVDFGTGKPWTVHGYYLRPFVVKPKSKWDEPPEEKQSSIWDDIDPPMSPGTGT